MPAWLAMRPRRPTPDHQEAVARRLALLADEMAAVRADTTGGPMTGGSPHGGLQAHPEGAGQAEPWWAGHTRVHGAEPPTRRPAPSATAPAPPLPGVPGAASGSRAAVADGQAPPVPVPGRHAARRSTRPPLATTLRERVVLGPGQLAVVAVIVAVALAAVAMWVVRSGPEAPEPVPQQDGPAPLVPLGSSGPPASPVAGAPSATASTVTVDVTGRVRRPGIVVLDAGARVVDALKAAGGARRGVDLSTLNLARLLVDGEQLLVGVPAAPALPGATGPATGSVPGAVPTTPLVNLNLATQAELESLPEVGPVTAQAILAWRDQHGGFTSVEELLEVDGIGEATLAQITPHVTL